MPKLAIYRSLRSGWKKLVMQPLRNRQASERALPDFLIIGAQKCGTTSLFHHLISHPQIVAPVKKEVHFFDGGNKVSEDIYDLRGEPWYRSQFPMSSRLRGRMTFEASPSYLYLPVASSRIRGLLPEAKLIALLRDPVERAISHYRHNCAKGRESLGFREAILQESSRLAGCDLRAKRMFSYRDRGLYAVQLKRFDDYRQAGRLLIIHSQDLFCDPLTVFRRVCTFLEIDPGCSPPVFRPRNVSRAEVVIEPETVAELSLFYQQPNQELWAWLGNEFGW